jgi:hypothetical protein
VRVPPRQGRGKTAAAGSREPNWHRPVRPKGGIELRAVAIGKHVELEQDRVLKFSEAMVRFCYLRSFSTRSSSTGSTGFRVRRHERARCRDAPRIVRLEDRSETILDPLKHGRTVVVSATPLWRAALRQQSGNSDQPARLWVNPHEETMRKKEKQQF